VVRTGARFHANHTTWLRLIQQYLEPLMTLQAALQYRLAKTINAVQLVNVLCQIDSNSTKLHGDSSFPFAGGIAYQFGT
jgi:hypothetical protein